MKKRILGDKFDTRIRLLVALGLSSTQIAHDIDSNASSVRQRAGAIGVGSALRANGERRRSATSRAIARHVKPWLAQQTSITAARRKSTQPLNYDFTTQRIVHALRRRNPVDTVCIDPDHVVACFHARGVTLPEIEDHLGVSPVEAVAAIRMFSEARS